MSTKDTVFDLQLGFESTIFEDLAEYNLTSSNNLPIYNEIKSAKDLDKSKLIVQDLKNIDWSFTEDETGFLTHDLHTYPAKFIPQIPGHLIARLTRPGELVLDPFGGSGTTALEAIRLGRRALSIDANAIATLIGKVKTSSLNKSSLTDLHSIRTSVNTLLQRMPSDPQELQNIYKDYIPEIPNIEKWFAASSCGELAFIKNCIHKMETEEAKNVALLALSRIILKVSFQDSETRYTSKPKKIPNGYTSKIYLRSLEEIINNILKTQPIIRYGISNFITADTKCISEKEISNDSIDFIVTSPPYGNSMDYHLYHRFRLLWLNYNPKDLACIEIGSHLRHQKESSGFKEYIEEMAQCLNVMYRVLRPGRYAALVVGNSIYKNITHNTVDAFRLKSRDIGFVHICTISREIHKTKRSFIIPGRRATNESIIVLRKPQKQLKVTFVSPPYKLWSYEKDLQIREIENIVTRKHQNTLEGITANIDSYSIPDAKRLVFTHYLAQSQDYKEKTWQAILENGFFTQTSARKDPKYVTHGIHPYKGKFYPQLAKALINISEISPGAMILDPFCGSGTTLLEGYLNGYKTAGCDMNPLAAMIAQAKIGVLEINPNLLREAIFTILSKLDSNKHDKNDDREQFCNEALKEITNWFPKSVISKLNILLRVIRSVTTGDLRIFFETILSSIIREVSHQDPNDLRIRKRKVLLKDADVFGLFIHALDAQYQRIERFWSIRGFAPNKFQQYKIAEGDSRNKSSFSKLLIEDNSVDLILTSPPYATALPYIDTDRLSLLILLGYDTGKRRPLEQNLVGSREISTNVKRKMADIFENGIEYLPAEVKKELQILSTKIEMSNGGFRKKNLPALLTRFLYDMDKIIINCIEVLKYQGCMMMVIGDNRTSINGKDSIIPTTKWIKSIALHRGFKSVEDIDITVTKESLIHMKNAITRNTVLWFKK